MKQRVVDKLWYEKHILSTCLLPAAFFYRAVVRLRRRILIACHQTRFDVPVVIVGNITVGGVGKTPLVIAMTEHFKAKALRVGIVSRGYGARIHKQPYEVQMHDAARDVGDEPLLLAQKTACPVVIAKKRVAAVQYLLEKHAVDVVISDDGLQHYKLGRAIEVAVVDAKRGFGNGQCLPAGPLREPKRRMQQVDLVVVNGADWPAAYRMDLVPDAMSPSDLPPNQSVAALAGIGHPARFFDTLTKLGIKHQPYAFPDHHRFQSKDLDVAEDIVVMTEKDAVKCHQLSHKPIYVLPVRAKMQDDFWE